MIVFLFLLIFTLPGLENIKLNEEIHEFHLSKCEIEFNADENTMEIALQMFIDDTELALAAIGYDSLRLFDEKEHNQADTYLFDYLSQHFHVKVDDQLSPMTWMGKEISDDLAGLWCYMTIDNITPKDQISVSNDVLMELFDDQRNIVKLKYDKANKAYFLFDPEESEGILTIKQ